MVELMILAAYLGILVIGGIISDYIFPKIPPLVRYIDSLHKLKEYGINLEEWEREAQT